MSSEVNKTTFRRVEGEVTELRSTVSELQLRMVDMRDEIELLSRDLNKLKETVAEDIKYLYDRT